MFFSHFGRRKPKRDTYTLTPSRQRNQQGRRYASLGEPTPFFPPGSEVFAVPDDPGDVGVGTCDEPMSRNHLTRKRSVSVGAVPTLSSRGGILAYHKPDPELVLAELDCIVNLDSTRAPLDLAGFLEVDDVRALHEQDLMDALTRQAWVQSKTGCLPTPDIDASDLPLRQACIYAAIRVPVAKFYFDIPEIVARCAEEIERKLDGAYAGRTSKLDRVFLQRPPYTIHSTPFITPSPQTLHHSAITKLLSFLSNYLRSLSPPFSSPSNSGLSSPPQRQGERALVPSSLRAFIWTFCLSRSAAGETDPEAIPVARTVLRLLPTPNLGLFVFLMEFLTTYEYNEQEAIDFEERHALENLGWAFAMWAFGYEASGMEGSELVLRDAGAMMSWFLEHWGTVRRGLISGTEDDGEVDAVRDGGERAVDISRRSDFVESLGGGVGRVGSEDNEAQPFRHRPSVSERDPEQSIIVSSGRDVQEPGGTPTTSAERKLSKPRCASSKGGTLPRSIPAPRQGRKDTSFQDVHTQQGSLRSLDELLPYLQESQGEDRILDASFSGFRAGVGTSSVRRDGSEVSDSEASISSAPSLEERLLDVSLDDKPETEGRTRRVVHEEKPISNLGPKKTSIPLLINTRAVPTRRSLPSPPRTPVRKTMLPTPTPTKIKSGPNRKLIDSPSRDARPPASVATLPTFSRPAKAKGPPPSLNLKSPWSSTPSPISTPTTSSSGLTSFSSVPTTPPPISASTAVPKPPPIPSTMSNLAPTLAEAQRHIRALERELERSEVVVAQAVGETFRMRERVVSLERRVRELEGELTLRNRARDKEGRVGVRRGPGTWRG